MWRLRGVDTAVEDNLQMSIIALILINGKFFDKINFCVKIKSDHTPFAWLTSSSSSSFAHSLKFIFER